MQFKERPPSPPSGDEPFAGVMTSLERDLAKERTTLKGMWEKAGDVVRDIDTANKMAKDKFDGDSALMHVARGAVTTGVGAGLEKAMDYVWDKVWSGEIPFYDKAKFGEGMTKNLNMFARESDLKARLTYFMKEGTQDLSVATFYNFLAFRSQPILPKASAEHLVRSLGIDALEAAIAPTLPQDVRIQSLESDIGMLDTTIQQQRKDWQYLERTRVSSPVEKRGEGGQSKWVSQSSTLFPEDTKEALAKLNKTIAAKLLKNRELTTMKDMRVEPTKLEDLFRTTTHLSNPVTLLGLEWMGAGFTSLVNNYKEVRKARKEKGGLQGKRVFMPKEDHGRRDDRKPWADKKPWQGDRKPWEDRRQPSERRQPDQQPNADHRVYYGKGKSDQKALEEYELKGS